MQFSQKHWNKIEVRKSTGCWLWTGSRTVKGYGEARIDGKTRRSHRVAMGEPDGLLVLHSCDVPACVNQDHLFVGSARDNTADMIGKGRGAYKLSSADADEIRKEYAAGGATHRSLGKKYNVTHTQIGYIVRGDCWQ